VPGTTNDENPLWGTGHGIILRSKNLH
jgi:hypothetical protein